MIERMESNPYLSEARALQAPLVLGDATLARTLETGQPVTRRRPSRSSPPTTSRTSRPGLAVRDQLGERWAEVPVVLRVFDRQLGHRLEQSFGFRHVWSTVGDRRAVVRRRGARSRRAVHVLRGQPPVPAGAPARERRRRPRRSGDARAAGHGARDRDPPRGRRGQRSSTRRGATRAWRPTTTPTSSVPTPSCLEVLRHDRESAEAPAGETS